MPGLSEMLIGGVPQGAMPTMGSPEQIDPMEMILAMIMNQQGGIGAPMANAFMTDERYSPEEKYGKLLQGNVMPYEDIPNLDTINAMIQAQQEQPPEALAGPPEEGLLRIVMEMLEQKNRATEEAMQY
jgi:hypothetical protein